MDRHNSSAKKRDVVSISIEAEKQIYLNDPSFEQKSRGFAESAGKQGTSSTLWGIPFCASEILGWKCRVPPLRIFFVEGSLVSRYPKKGMQREKNQEKSGDTFKNWSLVRWYDYDLMVFFEKTSIFKSSREKAIWAWCLFSKCFLNFNLLKFSMFWCSMALWASVSGTVLP